jgi:hypothetical protein
MMVTRGTWRTVTDRSEWIGRRDAARAYLKTAQNALAVAEQGDDGRLIVQGAILAAIAYADSLTIKIAGIKNATDHQRLPATMRHALGNQVPQTELTRLMRLLERKNDSAYGHRPIPLDDARAAIENARAFALWAEPELVYG